MSTLRKAVIFDVDGTLADVASIRHFVRGARRDFEAFHSASVDVPPHDFVVDAARRAHEDGFAVLVVTARRAKWRNHTAFWLALHGVPSDGLWMRADSDGRPDAVVKADILARIRHSFDVVHAWDDNPSVLEVWRQHGISTSVVPGWVG